MFIFQMCMSCMYGFAQLFTDEKIHCSACLLFTPDGMEEEEEDDDEADLRQIDCVVKDRLNLADWFGEFRVF